MTANTCPSCSNDVNVRKIDNEFRANIYTVHCSNCNISLSKGYNNLSEMLAIWNALYP